MADRSTAHSGRVPRLVVALACLAAALFVAPTAGDASVAAGENTVSVRSTKLPFKGFGDITSHRKSGRIFVTEGAAGHRIAVLNERGRLLRVVRRNPGPMGMVIHGKKLYVAMRRRPVIVIFDLFLRRVRRVKVGPITASAHLAKSAGRLWFTMEDPPATPEYLASLRFQTHRARTYRRISRYGALDRPGFAASSSYPGRMFVWSSPGSTPTDAYIIDVRGRPQTVAAASPLGEGSGGGTLSAVITPNGKRVITASRATYGVESFDVSNLRRKFRYEDTPYLAAADVSSSGRWIASANRGLDASTVFLYRRARAEHIFAHRFRGGLRGRVFPGALEFVPGRRRVVVITGDGSDGVWLKLVRFPKG